jgi:hypothetical protein
MTCHSALMRGRGEFAQSGEFSDVHEALMGEIRQRHDELRTKVDAAAREGKGGIW